MRGGPNARRGAGPSARLDAGAIAFWLIIMTGAVFDIAHGRARPAWLAGAALAAFVVLYVITVFAVVRPRIPAAVRYGLLAALAGFTIAYVLRFGYNTQNALPLLSMAAGAALPLVWQAGAGVGVCTAVGLVIGLMEEPGGIGTLAIGTATAGTVIVVLRRLFTTIGELHATREELAHAAVSRERLRFARDLHDLLGHTLSLIVVKGEVVQRLATRDPAAASTQAGDIVTIGRDALGEVRQAVSGYRARGVSAELDDARMALDDAGVEAVITRTGPPPPAEADLLLGWVVREAVTNVIRHAAARHCHLTVTGTDTQVTVTITDDGCGTTALAPGNGLTGLTERLAAAGGELHAEPGRRGGFTVTATVPVDPPGPEADPPDAERAGAAGPEPNGASAPDPPGAAEPEMGAESGQEPPRPGPEAAGEPGASAADPGAGGDNGFARREAGDAAGPGTGDAAGAGSQGEGGAVRRETGDAGGLGAGDAAGAGSQGEGGVVRPGAGGAGFDAGDAAGPGAARGRDAGGKDAGA